MDSCICGCNRGACIPQREFDRQRTDPLTELDLQEIILFGVNGECGYPLKDALCKQYTGLDGREEKVFVGFKSSVSIRLEVRLTPRKPNDNPKFRFQWLPYERWTRQVGIDSRIPPVEFDQSPRSER